MIKLSILSTLVILIFSLLSCKVTQETFKTEIQIPEKFELNSSRINFNEIKKDSNLYLQSRKEFFKDSNLIALIDEAVINNFDMQLVFQKLQQTRSGIQFTRGIRLPELGLNLNAGQEKFGDYTIDGVGNYDTQFSPNLNSKQRIPAHVPDFYAGVYSSWEVDLWGKLKDKKRASIARFLAQEQGINLMTTQLISEIAETYYKLVVFDREVIIIEENIELQENALMVVSAQKETGKSNELAIEMMSAQLLNAKVLLFDIKQLIIQSENKLNFLVGRYPQSITRSPLQMNNSLGQITNTVVPSSLLENRPDIQAACFEVLAQNADLRAAKAAFYPNLTINGNMGFQAFRAALFFDPGSFAYSFLGGIASPILNRRALKADLMMTKASHKTAYLNYERTVVKSFTEVFEVMQLLENLKNMQSLKMEEVEVLKKSIGTSQELFITGRANYLEIITSQKNYLQSQIELLDINYNNLINQISLYKSLGGGWE